MKLIQNQDERFVFQINPEEKALLLEILQLYPLVAPAHHQLSRKTVARQPDDRQRLLEESLAAQRVENRNHVRNLLADPGRFEPAPKGLRLNISRPEIEWLLQVLNDVRVGSWIALGSPDTEHGEKIPLNEKSAPHVRSMELAGAFEMVFLDALTGRQSP